METRCEGKMWRQDIKARYESNAAKFECKVKVRSCNTRS
jgi:hypothetical protein